MNNPTPKRIALVGHCFMDGPMLQGMLQERFHEAQVVRVNDPATALAEAKSGAILLVNRNPIGLPQYPTGVEVIADIKSKVPNAYAALVSDRNDAQELAEAAGALPGFGKAQIWRGDFHRLDALTKTVWDTHKNTTTKRLASAKSAARTTGSTATSARNV